MKFIKDILKYTFKGICLTLISCFPMLGEFGCSPPENIFKSGDFVITKVGSIEGQVIYKNIDGKYTIRIISKNELTEIQLYDFELLPKNK